MFSLSLGFSLSEVAVTIVRSVQQVKHERVSAGELFSDFLPTRFVY